MSGAWPQAERAATRLDPTELRLAGYAALFGIADAAGDVIAPSAFDRTLRASRDPLPLFWQHKPDQRIGWISLAQSDEKGLQVIAVVDNPHSRAAQLLKSGAVSGLSFGYRARQFETLPKGRRLIDIELLEISVVSHPLQHGARVHLLN